MSTKNIEYNLIKELFNYKDGQLIRKVSTSNRAKKGDMAGCFDKSNGYIKISINNTNFYAHRIIWTWHFGEIPQGLQIDHINGNRSDNRIKNLRLVTHQENQFNQLGANGFHWNKSSKKYQAEIVVNGNKKYLGVFNNKSNAKKAYLDAKKELHHYDWRVDK